MISPTRKAARKSDNWGSGAYGTSRGQRRHKGTDFVCEPEQEIAAPIEGILIREARPYVEGGFSGCVIQGEHITIKMFYMKPDHQIIGSYVHQNDIIGVAQDITIKYPGMTPHIHLEVESIDPELLTFI